MYLVGSVQDVWLSVCRKWGELIGSGVVENLAQKQFDTLREWERRQWIAIL